MQARSTTGGLALPPVLLGAPADRGANHLLRKRELRRARLLRYVLRRRLAFLALHVGLGLGGWAVLGATAWGIATLLG